MSDLPRLLLCVFDVVPAPTALSRRVTEYLKGLSERYQVVVLSVKTPDHTHIERYHGARLLRVPVGSGDLAARVQAFDRAVRRQMESEEYVVVHSFDPFGGYALAERRGEFGYKLVYDACSLPSVDLPFLYTEEEANRRFIAKVRRQELFCLMNADTVITANELTRDFITQLGVPREQVQVLPAPVDLGPYAPEVMGLPDSTPMKLLHLGHQGDAQDLTTLLNAMQLALQTTDVRLTIVGPKSERHQARLEEKVAELKLTGKVEFQPPVAHDDLHKVLATVDVGLLTLSDVERNSRVGSPLARLAEYLAAGRPVIAADVPSARALLPEDGAVLYRSQDAASLADAIVSLATQPARRVQLGAAARAAAIDRDAAKIRADLFAIYVTLSGTGARKVGDEEATSADEPTQLGQGLAVEEETQKKKRKKKGERESPSSSSSGRVQTDPNIPADETSPEGAMGNRPAIMGTPLRDDPHTTAPGEPPPEPPVVMGAPEHAPSIDDVAESPPPRAVAAPATGDTAAPAEEPASAPVSSPIVVERDGARETPGATEAQPRRGTDARAAASVEVEQPHPGAGGLEAAHGTIEQPSPSAGALAVASEPDRGAGPLAGAGTPDPGEPPIIAGGELRDPDSSDEREEPSIIVGAELGAVSEPSIVPGIELGGSTPEPAVTAPLPPTAARATWSQPSVAAARPPVALTDLEARPLPPIRRPTLDRLPPTPASPTPADGLPPIRRESPRTAEKLPVVPPVLQRDTPPALTFSPPVLKSVPVAPPPDETGEEAPFVDDADLASVHTPARGVAALKPVAVEEPELIDDSELSPVGNTPAKGVAVPPTAPRFVPPIPRTPSGIFAAAMPPPIPRTPSGIFAAAMPPPLPRTPSGVFPSASAPRTTPPELPTHRGAAPPPLPRNPSGGFQVPPSLPPVSGPAAIVMPPEGGLLSEPAKPPMESSPTLLAPAGSGLFPEPPQIPSRPPMESSPTLMEGSPAESLIEEMADELVQAAEVDVGPPPSAIDAWFAMLVHGYCPPASNLFARHTPPTTMPGRDS